MKQFLLSGLAVFTACLLHAQTDLTPQQFSDGLERDRNEMLIDVRQDWEVKKGSITGAVNYDWMDENFMKRFANVPKDTPIYVYCAAGGRSSEAAEALTDAGFTKVYNLGGGFMAWIKAGMKVEE